MIYALACSTTYPVAVIVTSLFRAGILTQETIVVDFAIIDVSCNVVVVAFVSTDSKSSSSSNYAAVRRASLLSFVVESDLRKWVGVIIK